MRRFAVVLAFFTSLHAAAATARLPTSMIASPLTLQETDYSCGASAFLSVAEYWGAFNGSEQDLYGILGTNPKNGTPPAGIVRGAKHFGLSAEFHQNMLPEELEELLDEGATVIVDLQAWSDANPPVDWANTWENGHYVVLVGVDQDFFYFMDPSTEDAYTYMPYDELMTRWHDYEDEKAGKHLFYQSAIVIRGLKSQFSVPATKNLERLL